MQIVVSTNFPQLKVALDEAGRQGAFAMAKALILTARDVKAAEVEAMRGAFDRPTNFTLNSLYVKGATKADLTARVWFKWSDRPNHYLLPQVHGGARPLKRFEEVLVKAGYMYATERAVPGAAAALDAFGNMSRGQIIKVLSQLKAFNLAGSSANATTSRRSKGKRVQEEYFLSRGPRGTSVGRGAWKGGNKVQHLPRGVWVRRSFAQGTSVKPVLLFVKSTSYQPRFKFFDVANAVVQERLPIHFDAAFIDAIRTAIPRTQGTLL